MFEQEALTKVVKDALIDVPKDAKAAILTVANGSGVKFVAAIKTDDDWDLQGYVTLEKNDAVKRGVNIEWGVAVQKVW